MKELLLLLQNELSGGRGAMLLTILETQGSVPRGPGAMLLVGESGPLCGTVGGGAIEYEATETARQLLREKRSARRTFCLGGNGGQDVGMVCGGMADVWFSYVPAGDPAWNKALAELTALLASGRSGRLIQRMDGGPPSVLSEPGPPSLREDPLYGSETISLHISAGERAVVFGGGHCALALVPLLQSVGFRITVFEEREEFAKQERFPAAERVILGSYASIGGSIALSPEDYVVVMTNGHNHDFTVLQQSLRLPLAYVGCMGSRRKTAIVNARLREAGVAEDAIARLHAPIGIPIGAETPEEIAMSIAGEMVAVRAARRKEAGGPAGGGCPMQQG